MLLPWGGHASAAGLTRLTPRETDILIWLVQSKTNGEIGQILNLSPRTVGKHLEHLYQKLGVENRMAAVALVLRGDREKSQGNSD
jgi:DNA-binding CsgD family transcriptional regulator